MYLAVYKGIMLVIFLLLKIFIANYYPALIIDPALHLLSNFCGLSDRKNAFAYTFGQKMGKFIDS